MAKERSPSDTERALKLREALESRTIDFYAALQGVDPGLCRDVLTQYFSENDCDYVVDWAYSLGIPSAKAVVQSLFDIIKDRELPVNIRVKAMFAVNALPPKDREPNPADLWPQETLEYALNSVSEVILKEGGEVREGCESLLDTVLYHWYYARRG